MVKQAYDYDLLVIGAGAAGSTAASTAAQNFGGKGRLDLSPVMGASSATAYPWWHI